MPCENGRELDEHIQAIARTPEPDNLERLKELHKSLLEPELAVHIIENLPSSVIIARQDETIFYVNRETEFTFKYARGELFNKDVACLVPDRLMAAHKSAFKAWMAKPALRSFSNGLETFGLTKDGLEIPILIALMPVVIVAGFYVVATIRKKPGNDC
jgi:PAS domain S-box-containing protein